MGKSVIKFVKKRDGRIVPFDKEKIAEAIFKAAQSVGGENKYLAEDLAEAVSLYLEKNLQSKVPSVEEIQDIVERVLIKTGHAKTAKAYILYREKRANIRKVREGIKPEDFVEREKERINFIRNIKISVQRSDENLREWNREKIIEALLRETGISRNIAEIIVSEVEEEVITSKLNVLTSSLIRELVNAKLIKYGFEKEREKHARLGIPLYDVSNFFKNFSGIPDELSLKFGKHIKKEYALSEVFSEDVVFSHFKGEIFLHSLEEIDKFYSVEIHSELKEEERNIVNNYCSFLFLKPVDSMKIDFLNNFEDKKTKISFDLPLPESFEILLEIVKKKNVEIELKKEKEKENLVVQKITLNSEKIFDTSRIIPLIKKAFEKKEKFLESILRKDIKEFFKRFKKIYELEITGENEEIFKKITTLNGYININFKEKTERIKKHLYFLEKGNVKITSEIDKEKMGFLKDIDKKFFVRVKL